MPTPTCSACCWATARPYLSRVASWHWAPGRWEGEGGRVWGSVQGAAWRARGGGWAGRGVHAHTCCCPHVLTSPSPTPPSPSRSWRCWWSWTGPASAPWASRWWGRGLAVDPQEAQEVDGLAATRRVGSSKKWIAIVWRLFGLFPEQRRARAMARPAARALLCVVAALHCAGVTSTVTGTFESSERCGHGGDHGTALNTHRCRAQRGPIT